MRLNFVIVAAVCGFSELACAAGSHCSKEESVIFNCSVGKNTVSVCASSPIDKESGYLQYRFGPVGSPELAYPDKLKPPANSVTADTLTFAGGGGAYLRFTRNRYSYTVYTAIGQGWGEKAGVSVEKNGKRQINLSCKDRPVSELGPDFFDQAGLTKDESGFDLP